MQSPTISGSGPRIVPKPGVIADYCTSQGITRNALARRMDMHGVTLWKIDNGHAEPSPKFIARLIEVTGLGFDDLFVVERAA